LGPPEDGEPGEEEEQGSAASAAAQGLSAPEAPGAEMGGGAGEEGEGSCTAPGGCGAGGGTGRAQRDAVRAGEPAEVSVVMGQVLLHPGEGDSDSGSDGAGESGGADGGAVLETAVQEIAIPALGLHLAGAPAAPPARPAWVEPALGVAAMPFLDAGYRADFHAAYSGAREQVLSPARDLIALPALLSFRLSRLAFRPIDRAVVPRLCRGSRDSLTRARGAGPPAARRCALGGAGRRVLLRHREGANAARGPALQIQAGRCRRAARRPASRL